MQRLTPLTPLILGLVAFAAHAAPFAYVPNEKSGTVSVIDTSNDQVVADIKAGDKRRGLAASKDGKRLYVSRSNSVSVIDTESNTVLKEVAVGGLPWGVVVR